MKKITTFLFAVAIIVLTGACRKVETPVTDNNDDEEIIDSIVAQFEVDDSISLESSELTITDFIGFEETYSKENYATLTKHLRLLGMKEMPVRNDTAAAGVQQAAWGRSVEFVGHSGDKVEHNPNLRFYGTADDALGLYIEKGGNKPSEIFFTDKRLVPVYVRELQTMGYELQTEKSSDNMRYYSPKKEKDAFEQSFCLVITDQGCALMLLYDPDDDKK